MNPYGSLETRAFWSPAVGKRNMFDIDELWRPKFCIRKSTKAVTFGSCFAQHFGHALEKNKFAWTSVEKPPRGMTAEDAKRFNYNVFSARTGNIYTTSLLLQWTRWATGDSAPPEDAVWEKAGRFYDPFRPNIEPDGFASAQEMRDSRQTCIRAFRDAIETADMFVFTLGLTESWWEKGDNGYLAYEYAMCPGTLAGTFDADRHIFVNQDYEVVRDNLLLAIRLMRSVKPALKFLLTVSPVPLTATNSGNHVLVATMQSKSILRAVASAVVEVRKGIDYFPSYEIINAAPFRGTFFEANMRSVNPHGVDHVMSTFFRGLQIDAVKDPASTTSAEQDDQPTDTSDKTDDLVCEEELLAAFAEDR
jgi:hypothetical protein